MPKLKTPDQLRQLLEGVRWSHFLHKTSSLKIKKVRFHARMGLHLRRPALAILAQQQFVVLRHIEFDLDTPNNLKVRLLGGGWREMDAGDMVYTEYWSTGMPNVLDPSNPMSGFTLMSALQPYHGEGTWERQILNIRQGAYVVEPALQRTGPRHSIKILKGSLRGR